MKTRRGVYKDAINRAANDAKIIDEQQSEIDFLASELEKFRPRQEAVNDSNASKVVVNTSLRFPKPSPYTKK